ncbi:MAG: pyrroline-5-carboxylate reductase [Betaproteobacteria bacterium]|nr:pyrroline-5-carboxylate reductase [Betaproteobacteria bacterium]
MSILFVGGGNMASALIGGLISHGQSPDDIRVVEIQPEAAERLRQEWGVQTYGSMPAAIGQASTLVLAVKPQQLRQVLAELPPLSAEVRVISVAAGIRTDSLSRWLRGHANIVRAMPNTPALVRQGVAGLYAMAGVSEEDRLHAQSLLRAVGSVVWVEKESDLDAVTAVSGSGPAYVFRFMEAMIKAAVSLGLDENSARLLVLDTVLGAAQLAKESPDSPETLRRKVTSPGGTTEAAIAVFEGAGLEPIVIEAVQAASRRSCELGDKLDRE